MKRILLLYKLIIRLIGLQRGTTMISCTPVVVKQFSKCYNFTIAKLLNKELWSLVKCSDLKLFGIKKSFFAKEIHNVSSLDKFQLYDDLVAIRLPKKFDAPQKINPYKLGRMI